MTLSYIFLRPHGGDLARTACLKPQQLPKNSQAAYSVILVAVLLSSCLGLGWSSALTTALLELDNRHCRRNEFYAAVATVRTGVQLAVIVEVVLAIELILSTEFAGEAVGPFAVVTIIC